MEKERLKFCLDMRRKYPESSMIHPSVVIPRWVSIGQNVSIHVGVTLGSQGFGFEKGHDESWLHIPHIGQVIIEDDVEIFEGTNVCRGTVENTIIGKGTKIDALCHIGHNAVIGKNCIIAAKCMIGGCKIGDDVWIGPSSSVIQKVEIANGVFIGIGSNVVESIKQSDSVWAGNPAKFLRWKKEEVCLDGVKNGSFNR